MPLTTMLVYLLPFRFGINLVMGKSPILHFVVPLVALWTFAVMQPGRGFCRSWEVDVFFAKYGEEIEHNSSVICPCNNGTEIWKVSYEIIRSDPGGSLRLKFSKTASCLAFLDDFFFSNGNFATYSSLSPWFHHHMVTEFSWTLTVLI